MDKVIKELDNALYALNRAKNRLQDTEGEVTLIGRDILNGTILRAGDEVWEAIIMLDPTRK